MILTKIRPQQDGSLVLPAEALRPLNLEPSIELVLEEVSGAFDTEGIYLLLRQPLTPEIQLNLRRQQASTAQTSLDKIYAHLNDPGMAALLFYEFRETLERLWSLSRTAEKPYRQVITLLQMGARKLREKHLETHHLDAMATVLAKLESGTLTSDDIGICDDLLRTGGVDVMVELPPEVFWSYREELGRDVPHFPRNDDSELPIASTSSHCARRLGNNCWRRLE